MKPKLCVCGRSKALPLCDNSHESEGWSCAATVAHSPLVVVASSRYLNLAKKLAHHYAGAALESARATPLVCERLVVLADPTDLEQLSRLISTVEADESIVFVVGFAPGILRSLFPTAELRYLDDSSPLSAFQSVRQQLSEPPSPTQPMHLPRVFVSHAVSDEPRLAAAIDYLRRFLQASYFLCSDSIAPGTAWQSEIVEALRDADRFVAVISAASLRSHFCSFEAGMALALDKPIRLISLDGSRPPLFLAHLQCLDLALAASRRPWLSDDDRVLDALLRCSTE